MQIEAVIFIMLRNISQIYYKCSKKLKKIIGIKYNKYTCSWKSFILFVKNY